ncbi:hypothetical protein PRBRB14_22760 [Hallella multisaccharivorax DSM 17128]|nr:hypothetical protein PRBRB14_22760 [Hallella multisaccharivorax DSM 17128]
MNFSWSISAGWPPCGPPQTMFDRFIIGYDASSGRAQGPTLHYKEWLAIAKM